MTFCRNIPGMPVILADYFCFFMLRIFQGCTWFKTHDGCILYVPYVSAAIDMEEFGQIVLIKMHIIPATQVKFLIKTPLCAVIAELLLFTPS